MKVDCRDTEKALTIFKQAQEDAIVADPSTAAHYRDAARLFYRCSQHEEDQYLKDQFTFYYADSLFHAAEADHSGAAMSLALNAARQLQHYTTFDDIKTMATAIIQKAGHIAGPRQIGDLAAAPKPTPNLSLCEKSEFKEALGQWENAFTLYANATDASSRAYNDAVQQSRSSTYIPSTLSPGLQNALYNVVASQQNLANQRAAQTVQQAFARERQALSVVETDEQGVLAAEQQIHDSGASQTVQIAQQLTHDVEAITQYSSSFTAEGHLGQAGVDDVNHIKASKLDYDDAARQMVQLPYCSK